MLGLWNGTGTKFIVAIKDKKVRHIQVQGEDQGYKAADFISRKGWDTYFAISEFSGQKRLAKDATTIRSLWIDLDCGEGKPYISPQEGLCALKKFTDKYNVPPSIVVYSGYGLHVYWRLDEGLEYTNWLPLAKCFKKALSASGVQADPARTADAASILRIPGTMNWKNPDSPQEVRLVKKDGPTYTAEQLQQKFPDVATTSSAPAPEPGSVWDVPDNYPDSDAEKIASRCAQMAYIRDTKGLVPEPEWRAGLSILVRCVDGDKYIHEWSKGDTRYDPSETEDKANRTKGPATCEYFKELTPERCKGCQQQVTSPIQTGTIVVPEEPKKQTEPEPWRKSTVGRYTVSKHGIFFQPPAEDGDEDPEPVHVAEVKLWIREVRQKSRVGEEVDRSSILVEWITVDGRTEQGVLFQSDLVEPRLFRAWLADHNIISAVWDEKRMRNYISQYTLNLIKEQGVRKYHEKLGWSPEGFVLGAVAVDTNGPNPALVQSSNPIAKMKPQGSADKWTEAANILNTPGYEPHAMAVLAGFGSAILPIVDKQSAVVSLAGVSGAGKTLAAQFAQSIYGDPEFISQGQTATINAIEKQLSSNHHVPYLLDEITNLPANRLADFVYIAANGRGKASLTRSRDNRDSGSWQLVPFTTSNYPLLDYGMDVLQEAHRRRILEISFSRSFPREEAEILYLAMKQHAGSAGVKYLKKLASMKDQIPAAFIKMENDIRHKMDIPDANRFSLWTLAAARLGGAIAKSIGLIDMDIDRILQVAAGSLQDNISETRSPSEHAQDITKEFIARNSRRVCFWAPNQRDIGHQVDDPVARVMGDDWIAVHRRELNEEWAKHRLSRKIIQEWIDDAQTEPPKPVRLSPGTPLVKCYIMRASMLGLDAESIRQEVPQEVQADTKFKQ